MADKGLGDFIFINKNSCKSFTKCGNIDLKTKIGTTRSHTSNAYLRFLLQNS